MCTSRTTKKFRHQFRSQQRLRESTQPLQQQICHHMGVCVGRKFALPGVEHCLKTTQGGPRSGSDEQIIDVATVLIEKRNREVNDGISRLRPCQFVALPLLRKQRLDALFHDSKRNAEHGLLRLGRDKLRHVLLFLLFLLHLVIIAAAFATTSTAISTFVTVTATTAHTTTTTTAITAITTPHRCGFCSRSTAISRRQKGALLLHTQQGVETTATTAAAATSTTTTGRSGGC
mmetsp:Transcript_3976/g.9541  ORF Transcript_3976/g.9541 Transcript_3976/m.9541 type:complete len:232 (+) Transcript_3976:660-1355(+)